MVARGERFLFLRLVMPRDLAMLIVTVADTQELRAAIAMIVDTVGTFMVALMQIFVVERFYFNPAW